MPEDVPGGGGVAWLVGQRLRNALRHPGSRIFDASIQRGDG